MAKRKRLRIMSNTKRIEQAKELLTMIEGVDLGDSDTLDNMDAKWWCLKNGHKLQRMVSEESESNRHIVIETDKSFMLRIVLFSRSRDALKQARPEGWMLTVSGGWIGQDCTEVFDCHGFNGNGIKYGQVYDRPTEELAEFYCIVALWIYVWENE